MTNVKNFYNKFWTREKVNFQNYIRNSSLLDLFREGEQVLDVGCGDGVVASFLQKENRVKVIGIDISEKAVKKARALGVHAIVCNSENKFPFEDNSFDVVFWGDNLEHLFSPLSCLLEIKRVLKKDGRLILSCPNMGYFRYRFYYFLKGSLPDTEWTEVRPWEWSHIRFFNLKILTEFLSQAGFKKILKVRGISERRIDKILIPLNPSIFGMILLLEVKNG